MNERQHQGQTLIPLFFVFQTLCPSTWRSGGLSASLPTSPTCRDGGGAGGRGSEPPQLRGRRHLVGTTQWWRKEVVIGLQGVGDPVS